MRMQTRLLGQRRWTLWKNKYGYLLHTSKFGYLNLNLVFLLSSAIPVDIGCSSDMECPPSKACENRACVNPCRFDSPCSPRATCTPTDHKATCSCPPGMTGNPTRECHPSMFIFPLQIEFDSKSFWLFNFTALSLLNFYESFFNIPF